MLKAARRLVNHARRVRPGPITPSHCTQRILRREAEHLALRAHVGGDSDAGAKASWLFALLADFEKR